MSKALRLAQITDTGPRQTCFYSKCRNSPAWRDFRIISSSQTTVFTQLVTTSVCCKTRLTVVGKTRNIAIQLVL